MRNKEKNKTISLKNRKAGRAELIFLISAILLTFFFPILTLPITVFSFITAARYRKLFGVIIAFQLALIAYIWIPSENMDLYRWHESVKYFTVHHKIDDLLKVISEQLEPLNYLSKYLCARIGNKNLLQFSITFTTYSEMLWILSDYSENKKLKVRTVFICTAIILLSKEYIGLISGLFFNFATTTFVLGYYLERYKNKKTLAIILYICAICIHISTLYLVVLYIYSVLRKDKMTKIELGIVALSFFIVGPILEALSSFGFVFQYIFRMYDAYFLHGDQFDSLHSGTNLISSIMRLILCYIVYYSTRKQFSEKEKNCKLPLLLLLTLPALILQSGVFVRFPFVAELIIIPRMVEFFNRKTTSNMALVHIFTIFLIAFLARKQIGSISNSGIVEQIKDNAATPVYIIFTSR